MSLDTLRSIDHTVVGYDPISHDSGMNRHSLLHRFAPEFDELGRATLLAEARALSDATEDWAADYVADTCWSPASRRVSPAEASPNTVVDRLGRRCQDVRAT